MNQEEVDQVRKYAEECVEASLRNRILKIAAFFGIVNIAVLCGAIWWFARAIDDTVKSAAQKHAENLLQNLKELTQSQYTSLQSEYTQLNRNLAVTGQELAEIEETSQKLSKDALALRVRLDELNKENNIKLASQLIAEVAALSSAEAQNLVTAIAKKPAIAYGRTNISGECKRTIEHPFEVDFSPFIPSDPQAALSSLIFIRSKSGGLQSLNATIIPTSLNVDGKKVRGKVMFGMSTVNDDGPDVQDDPEHISNFNAEVLVFAKIKPIDP